MARPFGVVVKGPDDRPGPYTGGVTHSVDSRLDVLTDEDGNLHVRHHRTQRGPNGPLTRPATTVYAAGRWTSVTIIDNSNP